MNKGTLAVASLLVLVFNNANADGLLVEAGGTLTATTSPITVMTTGASTSTGSTSSSTTGDSTSTVGNLTTGSSTSTTGASTATGGTSSSTTGDSTSSGNTSGNASVTSNYAAPRIPVATAIAPANLPTAPCMGATSIGVSAVLFGFSTGSSWEATECMTLEMARSFSQDGQLEDAQAVRCSSKYAANAPSCIKLLQQRIASKPAASNISYIETIDPVTGFKTIIDTRNSFRRPALH